MRRDAASRAKFEEVVVRAKRNFDALKTKFSLKRPCMGLQSPGRSSTPPPPSQKPAKDSKSPAGFALVRLKDKQTVFRIPSSSAFIYVIHPSSGNIRIHQTHLEIQRNRSSTEHVIG